MQNESSAKDKMRDRMGHGMKKSGKLSGMKRHSGGKLKLGKGLGKR